MLKLHQLLKGESVKKLGYIANPTGNKKDQKGVESAQIVTRESDNGEEKEEETKGADPVIVSRQSDNGEEKEGRDAVSPKEKQKKPTAAKSLLDVAGALADTANNNGNGRGGFDSVDITADNQNPNASVQAIECMTAVTLCVVNCISS